VADNDNDEIKCRFAVGSSECGSICGALPNSNIEAGNCVLNFNTSGLKSDSYYGVSLQIEDFSNNSKSLSSTPLQFLIHITNTTNGCIDK
jgi:hypothetical protein